jgi:two-component system response regulator MprA
MPAQPGLNLGGRTLAEVRPTRILIVDDEPAIRQLVADILLTEGYVVSEAANGFQALSMVSRERPDAIVLDLMMPIMDGPTFVRTCFVQSLARPIPILLTSASPGLRQHADQLRPFGVHAWIAKPFDLIRLLERVAQLTEPSEPLARAL